MTVSKDTIAVITGAGSGIGRSLALTLAAEPVKGMVLSDINTEKLAETVAAVEKTGTQVSSLRVNVADLDDVTELKDISIKTFGEISHLFNIAGVGLVGRTEEVSLEDMKWLFDINFWGTVYTTKCFLPVFREQGFGHLINISSIFGIIAPPGQSTYCASKFAVKGFTESLRHELEGTNINVTCVHPGGIRTNIVKNARKGLHAAEEDQQMASEIFRKMAITSPDEAARVIIRGVKRANPRVLIGSDAIKISAIQRLFPKRYFNIIDRMSGGMLSRFK